MNDPIFGLIINKQVMGKNLFLLMFLVFKFLYSGEVWSQKAPFLSVKADVKFKNIKSPETFYVHTDRDFYVAGENLFFKSYRIGSISDDKQVQSSILYLVFRDEKANIEVLTTYLENGSSSGRFYIPDTLKTGYYQLVAFTNFMRNFDEKYYFKKSILIINRFDKVLSNLQFNDTITETKSRNLFVNEKNRQSILEVIQPKDSFKTREKIKLGLKLKTAGIANLSIAVKEVNFFSNQSDTIFQNLDQEKNSIKSIPTNQNDSITAYLPETNGIYLRGKLIDKTTQTLNKECILLSTADSIANFQYTFSDAKGNFQFLLNNYYLGKEVIIKPKDNQTDNVNRRIQLEDKFYLQQPIEQTVKYLQKSIYSYITYSQDIVYIQKSYPANQLQNRERTFGKLAIPCTYYNPTERYFPTDYVPLTGFNDIVTNMLLRVKLSKTNDHYDTFIVDPIAMQYRSEPAMIFLDGVPIDNADKIMYINSMDIDKIDICRNSKIKGDLELTGIISIMCKKNKINSIVFNSPSVKYKLDKITERTTFTPINYEIAKNQNFAPDFRQLLYWNANVSVTNNEMTNIEFFASDCISDYIVEVKGFLADGTPISTYAKIKVY